MWGILPAVIFSHVILFLDFGLVSVNNHFRFLTVCMETVMWSQWRNFISTVDVTYRFGKPKSQFLSRLSNEVAEAWSLVKILLYFIKALLKVSPGGHTSGIIYFLGREFKKKQVYILWYI